MAPTMVSKKIMVQSQLLDVSFTDGEETGLKGIDINTDPTEGGDGQLTKGQNIWDTEW